MRESVKTHPAAGMYWALASLVLCVASAISYYVLSLDGVNSPTIVYLLAIAAAVMQGVILAVNHTPKGAASYNCSSLLTTVLSAFALEQMLVGRLEWLGGLAAHNASLVQMHTSFFVTIVLFVAAIVTSVVAAFCKQQNVG